MMYLDILFISLPNKYAADATITALKKNINVFCEKPPARNIQELKKVGVNNVYILIGYRMYVFYDYLDNAKLGLNINYIVFLITHYHLFLIVYNFQIHLLCHNLIL